MTPELKTQFEARARQPDLDHVPFVNPSAPAQEIAPGIFLFSGSWNIVMVKQRDGVVIIEAPISAGYSRQAIEEKAGHLWPGTPVKAMITTSDAWPHLAGVGEYAARGIPTYALDVNRPILERNLGASARGVKINWVAGRTTLGDGPDRLEIYPLRGETTERQMMVYFPEYRLLYGSDAFQKNRAALFQSANRVPK